MLIIYQEKENNPEWSVCKNRLLAPPKNLCNVIMSQPANGSVANQFFRFGFQLVQHWFSVNRLALENGLVQFGFPMRIV